MQVTIWTAETHSVNACFESCFWRKAHIGRWDADGASEFLTVDDFGFDQIAIAQKACGTHHITLTETIANAAGGDDFSAFIHKWRHEFNMEAVTLASVFQEFRIAFTALAKMEVFASYNCAGTQPINQN